MTSSRGPASARSLSALAILGARQGDELLLRARGADAEDAHRLEQLGTECSLDYEGGPGMGGGGPYGHGPFGESSGQPVPISVENLDMLRHRQTADTGAAPEDKAARVNLLNWDGRGRPDGLFPPRKDGGDR